MDLDNSVYVRKKDFFIHELITTLLEPGDAEESFIRARSFNETTCHLVENT